MTALTDDKPQFRDTGEWGPPSDPDEFILWCAERNMSVKTFAEQMTAWEHAPAELKKELASRGLTG